MQKTNLESWFSLNGTTCVVAGGNGLIGKTTVQALSDSGANVLSFDKDELDITNPQELRKYFASLSTKIGNSSETVFINCTYPRTTNWGTLDFETCTLDDWNKNVELHLGSAFHFSQEAVLFLKQQKRPGSLINFGSIYGINGPDLNIYKETNIKNPVPYSAIKAGIAGFTRYIATTYGQNGIRANVICPGGLEDRQPEPFLKAYRERTPLKRLANAGDIAGTVAFLAGPSARYITGQTIIVDGGWTSW